MNDLFENAGAPEPARTAEEIKIVESASAEASPFAKASAFIKITADKMADKTARHGSAGK